MWVMIAIAAAGGIAGGIIAFSMDFKSPGQILQGAVGGFISGMLIALMLPK